ncbi:MAG: HAD family phosphatase [Lachnospiraceae bacterium]|nr:HAD family phosphatase [Lachnospiraceae bacterium]MDD3615609.1 HAD family phosphatase [Lachnospiraceae bacterium]
MKKVKQVLALVGVALLLIMYGSTLFFAMSNKPNASQWFMASLFCTIAVPVFLYALTMVANYIKKNKEVDEMKETIQRNMNEMPEIKCLIFDVGRVLVDFEWDTLLRDELKYDEDTIRDVAKAMFLSPQWNEMDRGILTDEELLESFVKNNPSRREEITQVFHQLEKTIRVRDYAYGWIDSLKKRGYKTYILSNYARSTFEKTKDSMNFIKLMDGCIWSYQWQQIKPEPYIYQTLIKEYGIEPEHALYMDDLQDNLDAAKKFGFQTLLFTEYEEVCDQLKSYLERK